MTKEQFLALGLTEEQATKAAEESAKELKTYIPKHRFDEVNEENKTLKGTVEDNKKALDDLKKSTGDAEALKKQIETLQNDNKAKDEQYQKDLKDLKLTNAIKLAVAGKVHDEELVSGLFDKSKLILADDGNITGLDEQLKGLREGKKFLFKEEEQPQQQQQGGFRIGGEGSNNQTPAKPASLFDAVAAAYQK